MGDESLRRTIRTRLATGSLFPVDGKVSAGKLCNICGMPISQDDIEHEVVGPTTVFAQAGVGCTGADASVRQGSDPSSH